ncbi:MAG TPA: ring-cleaving dioxygenase [Tepidisphaeraceae bacterium]|nr:ring-cleaving dioxygenase [Tepidisphaeraceae bacterium]
MADTTKSILGLHHVTAITADAQKNIDFYSGVLGLRLVKLTVNFDDPSSYHLYYGDELGRPGTIMTFFAWPGAHRGRIGPPQVSVTAFAVPMGTIDFWADRLKERSVVSQRAADRFGERVLSFADPDGLQLEIIETNNTAGQPWAAGPVALGQAIRGFHSVTIAEEGYEKTAQLVIGLMGFTAAGAEQNRFRYRAAAADAFAAHIDVVCVPAAPHGTMGAGVVHHVAFRAANDPQQVEWQRAIADAGFNVSPVMDRTYFHSIYYREPGGVLFEIATDSPGFTADQPAAELGTRLMLPPWLEPHRKEIERAVTPVKLP